MKNMSREEQEAFINALQLSIETKILSYSFSGEGSVTLRFETSSRGDTRFQIFDKLAVGKWKTAGRRYKFNQDALSSSVLRLLIITRLNKENLVTFLKQEPELAKLLPEFAETGRNILVQDLAQVRDIVFAKLQSSGTTLRELSETSGLTQATLFNFKAGKDIRLSSLLKILSPLGIELLLSLKRESQKGKS